MKALVGNAISEATLLAWIWRLHEALAEWEERATARLLASPVLHADETSIRIDGRNLWQGVVARQETSCPIAEPL